MRQRRVGTVSMGVLLIMLGGLLLYAQISLIPAMEIVIKWWPIILFLLGAEVLIYTALSKQDSPKVKYDLFSIFIILLIVLTGVGMYGLTEAGVIPRLNRIVVAQNFETFIS